MSTRSGQGGFTLAFTAAAAAVAVLVRLTPRWLGLSLEGQYLWNWTAVGAVGLFAGARLRWPWALAVPLLTMLAADLLLIPLMAAVGQPAFTWLTPVVYASFAVYAALGHLARRAAWPRSLFPACLLGSVQFFAVTNFFVWALGDGTAYPGTWAGLGECFVAAIPFFRNTVGGDLLYTGLFFGLYALAVRVRGRAAEKASQPV